MKIHELFDKDVTRDIPPVVYFHEQAPRKLREEVEEYIITGGFPKGDPRARRVEQGIHEGLVGLLRGITAEMARSGGPELPAAWISGFYGSGKSSFAKLLGLALDGARLDDGTSLSEALLRRDDSPRRQELIDAWKALLDQIDPIAVVFDIGAVARDSEHIHSAALRQIQARLGYCTRSNRVADYELKLELDGHWNAFLAAAEKTLGKPWTRASTEALAEDHFSHVLHVLTPDRYATPTDWIDSQAGTVGGVGTSPMETIEAIEAMLSIRAEGKALFIVVDEVSQYVHQDVSRMLKLQSFVSELGKRLKGAAWILATGQQKLEDSGDNVHISKLKDRFPARLRVHLAATNIRDVVHKRLLRKRPDREPLLRELFQKHKADLKLHGYSCAEITEEDFVEIYPMLPGHVDLLLQVTTALRTRSTRVQGDDHAIRGLLQLLGELFRAQRLADRDVGELVTLEQIYEVQQTALDPDVQTALARIVNHPSFRDDALALRVARAVALLELIQEQVPTTADLVAQCLYSRLGLGNQGPAAREALERLRSENLLGYSEKQGYKIQSSAGQEWERERSDFPATPDQRSELVADKLKELIGLPDRPRWKGNPFPFTALYSDGRTIQERRIQDSRTGASVTVDFRFLGNKDERLASTWVQRSDQEPLRDRLVWVVGDPGHLEQLGKDLIRSHHMIQRYEGRRDSLPREKQRLLIEEQSRSDGLETRMREAVAEAFFDGAIYFRGASVRPSDHGGAFATALTEAAKRRLPDLYPFFTDVAVTDTELQQLLEPQLSGPSTKFMEDGLGILALDSGRYIATCTGDVPSRILTYLEHTSSSGSALMSYFSKPPYGYPADVISACLAGLLRVPKIRIRPEEGPEITSVRDPGARDLFRKVKEGLGRAEILPAKGVLGPRDIIAICKLFEDDLDLKLDRENDAIADAVFKHFPGRREALRRVEMRLGRLPGRPEPPAALVKLGKALEACVRSRQVEEIVLAVKHHLEDLREGFQQLGLVQTDLTDETLDLVIRAAETRDHHLAQLRTQNAAGEVADEARRLVDHVKTDRPWRGIQELGPMVEAIRALYVRTRRDLVARQSLEVDQACARIKVREGYSKLNADQSHQVLRPIHEAIIDTTEDAIFPTLGDLRSGFQARLAEAIDQANDLLDEMLAGGGEKIAVKVQVGLQGYEVSSVEKLDALLRELDDRIRPLIKAGKRVRIY